MAQSSAPRSAVQPARQSEVIDALGQELIGRIGAVIPAMPVSLVAQALIDELTAESAFGRPIVTELLPLANYWPAEDYHQDFFERNPHQGYCMAVAAPKVAKFRKTFVRLAK